MIKAVVIGASFGGMDAIRNLLSNLPDNLDLSFAVVLHIGSNNINSYISMLNTSTQFKVKEAEEKEAIKTGRIYFAPPNYHLQIENNFAFSLSTDEKVNFSRPSIDVLFETAAWAYRKHLLGIILTGSNNDGASGLETIKKFGGTTIVQNPLNAQAAAMPEYAIKKCNPDYILDLKDIAHKIGDLNG